MSKGRGRTKGRYIRGIIKCYARKDYKAAIKEFDEAIRLNPNNPQYYQNRGRAWEKLGNIERAVKDFTEAKRLNVNNAAFYVNWGGERGKFAGAVSYEVMRVIDGDTILIDDGGAGAYVRFLGVDTP